jgi:hypothetical protein
MEEVDYTLGILKVQGILTLWPSTGLLQFLLFLVQEMLRTMAPSIKWFLFYLNYEKK